MNFYKDKSVLVVGAARSGISTIKALKFLGAKIYLNDIKNEESLLDIIDESKDFVYEYILGKHPENLQRFEEIILSPGVPTDLIFISKAKEMGIKVTGELEFAYNISKGKFVAITGTNGKTTTTSLVGEIFLNGNIESCVVGNIGVPVASKALDSTDETYMITEVSSFQLETIENFSPKISAVLNVTPDHLNRHKTMENYVDAKAKIFMNSGEEDYLILNYDNEICRNLKSKAKCKVVFFSIIELLDEGVFVENGNIVIRIKGERKVVAKETDIFIKGKHNLENVLAAVAISYLAGIDIDVIRKSLKEFRGVEHRIEFVRDLDDIKFYNDSKGTNPDASIKALEAMDRPTILIAGGMDKGSEFDEFVVAFGDTIKHVILIGETKEKIATCALKNNFLNYTFVEDMNEAVIAAYNIADIGYNILLSPACASWDMYESYEHRGREFKKIVNLL